MKFPKELTTATKLSKYLAMLVFVSLPIVGFFFGMRYQEMLDLTKRQEMEENLSIPNIPIPSPIAIPTADPLLTEYWKTYKNTVYGFEVKYPSSWFLTEHIDISESYGNLVTIVDKASGSIFINSSVLNTTGYNNPSIRYKTVLIDNRKATLQEVYDGNQLIEKNYALTINSYPLTISLAPHRLITFHIFDQILSTFKFTNQ